MKNDIIRLTAVAALAVLSSCVKPQETEKTPLDKPVLTVSERTAESFTISWEAVEGAARYAYENADIKDETAELSVTFEADPQTEYTVRVRALAEEGSDWTDSEWAEIKVVPEGGQEPEEFVITAEVNDLVVHVEVYPADKQQPYYAEVITEDQFKNDFNSDPQYAYEEILKYYKEIFGSGTFDFLKDIGDLKFDMDLTDYDMVHYVILAGFDEELVIETDVYMKEFKTGELPMSDNTFEVTFSNVTASTITATVVPSNNDPYTMVMIESEDLEGYSEDEVYSLMAKEYSGWISEHIYRGEMEMNYSSGLLPDKEYTLLVFGWKTVPNTDINRFIVRTSPGAPGSDVTFELYAEIKSSTYIYSKVVPSNDQVYYFSDMMAGSDYDYYEGDVEQYIQKMCDDAFMPLYMYVEMFAVAGETEYDYDYLEPDTDYHYYAVGLTIEGEEVTFFEPQWYEQVLRTPAE